MEDDNQHRKSPEDGFFLGRNCVCNLVTLYCLQTVNMLGTQNIKKKKWIVFRWESLQERNHSEDLDVDGRIILKFT